MQIALALVLTTVSACGLNLGYLLQHEVASNLPPLSLRRPIASLRSLLVERRWLLGFGIQVERNLQGELSLRALFGRRRDRPAPVLSEPVAAGPVVNINTRVRH